MLGQVVFIAFAMVVDGIELILDLLVIGVIVNRIIDIVVAGIFFLYAHWKGLTLAEDTKVYGSIGGTIVGEMIPGVDIAPFFTIDAWYITHSVKVKEAAAQQAVDKETKTIVEEQKRQEWVENYQQQAAQEQNESAQTEGQEVEEQETQEQEAPEQVEFQTNKNETGRIAPLQFKMPAKPKQGDTN